MGPELARAGVDAACLSRSDAMSGTEALALRVVFAPNELEPGPSMSFSSSLSACGCLRGESGAGDEPRSKGFPKACESNCLIPVTNSTSLGLDGPVVGLGLMRAEGGVDTEVTLDSDSLSVCSGISVYAVEDRFDCVRAWPK